MGPTAHFLSQGPLVGSGPEYFMVYLILGLNIVLTKVADIWEHATKSNRAINTSGHTESESVNNN